MKAKIKSFLTVIIVSAFWIGLWEIVAILYDNEIILPTFHSTFLALLSSIWDKNFLLVIAFSLLRVLLGFLIGSSVAIILAVISAKFEPLKTLFAPIMTVAKSAPVVAIIIIIWLLVGQQRVPIAISALMVMPIVWQNMIDGYEAIDRGLTEVCSVYGFSFKKSFCHLYLPTLAKYLFPGLITSSGLAFKAGIAAEIICMTKNSIGREIYDAKILDDSPTKFAWVVLVILLSLVLELAIKYAIRRIGKKWRLN